MIGEGQPGMSEPNSLIRDVVAELAQQHSQAFADFWAKPEDQQLELIERYGTYSDRELWLKRNEPPTQVANPPPPLGRWDRSEFIKRSTQAGAEFTNPPFPLPPAATLGSMGLNEQMLNDPGELSRGLASLSGQSSLSARMEATLTVTPSQDPVATYAVVQEGVDDLEGLAVWMAPQDRHGIGGNFPPEAIEDAPLSGAEWSELRQIIAVLRSQTVIPEQKPVEAIEAESRLKAFADKIRSFLGRCLDDYRSAVVGAIGTLTVSWAVQYGHSALSHLSDVLTIVGDAVQAWVHALGY
jgi:hypothetical protein